MKIRKFIKKKNTKIPVFTPDIIHSYGLACPDCGDAFYYVPLKQGKKFVIYSCNTCGGIHMYLQVK